MKNYSLQITFKTKLLNLFRLLFTLKPFEKIICNLNKKHTNPFYSKLIPPNYLYPKESTRNVNRNGLNYELDLSDVVDHFIFFDLPDNSIKKLYSLIKKEMIVLDIGANMGYTAMNFSKIIETKGAVIAFEPDEINYKRAYKNIALNKITNIQLHNIGLGRETKNEKLYIVNDGNRGMNRILSSSSNLSFTEIQIQKLDDFVLNNMLATSSDSALVAACKAPLAAE